MIKNIAGFIGIAVILICIAIQAGAETTGRTIDFWEGLNED